MYPQAFIAFILCIAFYYKKINKINYTLLPLHDNSSVNNQNSNNNENNSNKKIIYDLILNFTQNLKNKFYKKENENENKYFLMEENQNSLENDIPFLKNYKNNSLDEELLKNNNNFNENFGINKFGFFTSKNPHTKIYNMTQK